jgi:hypothetical protein
LQRQHQHQHPHPHPHPAEFCDANAIVVYGVQQLSMESRMVLESVLDLLAAEDASVATDGDTGQVQLMCFGPRRVVAYRHDSFEAAVRGAVIHRLLGDSVESDLLPLIEASSGVVIPPVGRRFALRISGQASLDDQRGLSGLVALEASEWTVSRLPWALSAAQDVAYVSAPRTLEKLDIGGCHCLRGMDLSRLSGLRTLGGVGHAALEELHLPSCLEHVRVFALSFSGLTEVDFGRCERLRWLPDYGLAMSRQLRRVVLPPRVGLGKSACAGCTALHDVSGQEVTEVAETAFCACPLVAVRVGPGHLPVFARALALSGSSRVDFGGSVWTRDDGVLRVEWCGEAVGALPAVMPWGSGVSACVLDAVAWRGVEVPRGACAGWIGLRAVRLGRWVRVVGERAFEGCLNLSSVEVGEEQLECLAPGAFSACVSLRSLSMRGVRRIGAGALDDSGLREWFAPRAEEIGPQRLLSCELARVAVRGRLRMNAGRLRRLDWGARRLELRAVCVGEARFRGVAVEATGRARLGFRKALVMGEVGAMCGRASRPSLPA